MPALLRQLREKTGPGLLFAASSVGVSHLVQSTRAGAEYGLTLAALIVGICLIKYPVYRFGSAYAAATGDSLIYSYRQQGRGVIALFTVALLIDMFIATAAVSLVTAGLVKDILHLELDVRGVAFALILGCGVMLITGRYRLFESVSKFFVATFCILIVTATGLAATLFSGISQSLFPPVVADRSTVLFAIAVAGWMPTSVTASVFLSAWVNARQHTTAQTLTPNEVLFDFNLGYFATMALALCFLVLGGALLYGNHVSIAQSSTGFAAQIMAMFTDIFGSWAYVVMAATTSVVMISTLLTLLDGPPRTLASILRKQHPTELIVPITLVQIVGTTLLLVLFMTSFTAFVDFAASTAFLTAPFLAYFNHRAMVSDQVPHELRPGWFLQAWSILGILFFAVFFVVYLGYRLTGNPT